MFALFPVGVGVGLLLGVWSPRLSGLIATLCLIGFYLAFLIDRSELPRGPWFIVLAGGGPALLIADWLKRRFSD